MTVGVKSEMKDCHGVLKPKSLLLWSMIMGVNGHEGNEGMSNWCENQPLLCVRCDCGCEQWNERIS